MKKCEKVRKSVKNYETILPFASTKARLLKHDFPVHGKTRLFSEGKKNAFTLTQSVFGKWHFFVALQNTKHYKNLVFQQAQGKTPNGTFGLKSAILGRGLKKVLLSGMPKKAVLCWYHKCLVFSAKHSFAEVKGCKLKKAEIYHARRKSVSSFLE